MLSTKRKNRVESDAAGVIVGSLLITYAIYFFFFITLGYLSIVGYAHSIADKSWVMHIPYAFIQSISLGIFGIIRFFMYLTNGGKLIATYA